MIFSYFIYVLTTGLRSMANVQERLLLRSTSMMHNLMREWIEFTTFFHFSAAPERQSLTIFAPAEINTLHKEHATRIGVKQPVCAGSPIRRLPRLHPVLALCSQSKQPFYEQPSFNPFLRETNSDRINRERRAIPAFHRF
jgi:hypothetical protein